MFLYIVFMFLYMFELIDGWFLRALNDTSNPFLKIFVAARADREGLRHVKIKRDCPRFFSLSTVILKNRVFLIFFTKCLRQIFYLHFRKKFAKTGVFFHSQTLRFSVFLVPPALGFPDFRLLRP